MDPLMGRVGNPLSLQKYLYAGDEPADSTDPSGQDYDSVSISLGTVMSGVMSTMAQAVPYALAAAITCEASLVTSFFETASSSPSQGLCKNRWFNHYTHEEGYAGILGKGQVDTSGDGYVYLTPDIYFTGATAKSRLALRRVPVGYFRIPEQDIVDITHRGTVGRANGEDGGGDEWVSPEPVAVARAVWIPVF